MSIMVLITCQLGQKTGGKSKRLTGHRSIMAFNQTQNKSKNQFAARMVSNKTGATISWVHITDDFARKVCGVTNVTEVTAEQAQMYLPDMHNNAMASIIITDMTAEREIIPASEF